MEKLTTDRGFGMTLLLLIVTFNLYGIYLVHAFAKETNIACAEDGKKTQGLLVYIILSIVTFGIYSIIWQCLLIERRVTYLRKHGKAEGLQLSTYLLTLFILGWLTLGIMYLVILYKYLYQQNDVNATYNKLNNL